MTNEELKIKITELLPAATFEEGGEWININVEPADWKSLASNSGMKLLYFLIIFFALPASTGKHILPWCIILDSTIFRHNIVVKSKLDQDNPAIETVCDIWKTANFHEREVYEMFGVNFIRSS